MEDNPPQCFVFHSVDASFLPEVDDGEPVRQNLMVRVPRPLAQDALGAFLDAFYAKVRHDPEIGPIFAAAIADGDWPAHLRVIEDFWSTVLFKTGRYNGNPFGVHVRKGIRQEHFERWLALFGETAREHFDAAGAALLTDRAQRIADSLKAGLYFRPVPPTEAPPRGS